MRIMISELTGAALDWAVARCEGFTDYDHATETMLPPRKEYGRVNMDEYSYSTDWAQGGPIIEREELSRLICYNHNDWGCLNGEVFCEGPTPLIAAMRCYVASKLGDYIDIPEELTP